MIAPSERLVIGIRYAALTSLPLLDVSEPPWSRSAAVRRLQGMTTPAQSGLDALRRGDADTARTLLTRATQEAPSGQRPWLLLAQACRLGGDPAAERRALEALLHDEPRHIPGLLIMGERSREDGDERAAAAFYTTALNQAAVIPPPPQLHALLARARDFLAAQKGRYEAHLLSAVDLPDAETAPPTRFRRSLDLLLGRRELHLQQPSMFYFPGLPQRAFFDRAEFPWAAELEAAVPAIRAELEALDGGFDPYVTGTPGRPRPNNPLLDDPGWGAFHIWRGGELVAENAARVPRTVEVLARLPIPRIAGRSPMALFSRLTPGTHIRPHHGMLNTRLICHLPLVVPEGCAMRVGDETRPWREGELTVFDDSFEHEAWNRGPGTRTVLLFEIWRPDIDADERAQLTRLFEAIDAYGGFPPATGADH